MHQDKQVYKIFLNFWGLSHEALVMIKDVFQTLIKTEKCQQPCSLHVFHSAQLAQCHSAFIPSFYQQNIPFTLHIFPDMRSDIEDGEEQT